MRLGRGLAEASLAALQLGLDRLQIGLILAREPSNSSLGRAFLGAPQGHRAAQAVFHGAAFEQLALMVMQGFPNIDKTLVIEYVRSIIPIVIQGRRAAGRRFISEIYYADADRPVSSS